MALITRISRLFTADLHAVLDRMEEPEIVLKQAARDMQAAVAASERQIRGLRGRAEQTACAMASAQARLSAAAEELDVCLDAGDDDLARSVIQRKLQLERTLAELEAAAERIRRSLDERERTLSRRQQELDALRSKSAVFETAEREDGEPEPSPAVSREEVEVALLRAKQRRARP
jgi:phage shock protein A